jgi:adenosylhomocysteinase
VIGSNPLATQDDVVAALEREERVEVNAWHGIPHEEHIEHIETLLDREPTLVVEDGGEVAARIASRDAGAPDSLIGITEETTTGVEQLERLEAEGRLPLPAIAVNSARMKHLIDNRYGTGQSTWDAIMRSTNLLVAGKTVVIVGYGWCGKGLAIRSRGLGARVVVCELDEIKCVEALMEGFAVSSLERALPRADIVLTATGQAGVIDGEKLRIVKGGAVLANAGHFGFEIDKAALESMAASHEEARPGVHAYTMPDGRVLYLIGGGELVNLSVGDGHPVEIMDISFALQALSLEYLAKRHRELDPRVHPVPDAVERDVAKLVLAAMT